MDLDADIDIRSRKLFDDADLDLGLEARILDLASNALGPAVTPGDARTQHRQYLRVSGMERAILETLEEIPRTVSFEHGAELFEGLTTLRPKLAQALLKIGRASCRERVCQYV